jgi:hypothetical protein
MFFDGFSWSFFPLGRFKKWVTHLLFSRDESNSG